MHLSNVPFKLEKAIKYRILSVFYALNAGEPVHLLHIL